MRLDDPRNLERVAGRLERDLIVTAEALRQQLKRRRLALHPPRQPHLPSFCDRDLAEVAMDIQADEPHRTPPPLSLVNDWRRGGRHDNYGSVRAAHPDSRKGGHLQTAGSQPIMCDGLPNLRPPEAPAIRTRRRYGNDRTMQRLHLRSFISLQRASAAPRARPAPAAREQAARSGASRSQSRRPSPRSPRRLDP